jgi:hypothetical protein
MAMEHRRMTGNIMKKPAALVLTVLLAATMFASHPVAASAASVVATINGGGTALMASPPGYGVGVSSFGIHATLYADGSARGQVDCVDQMGDPTGAGNIFGAITSWSRNADGTVNLYVTNGKFVPIPGGHPASTSFTITIQSYGGAGVGHWTLTLTPSGFLVCYELVTSGQIVSRTS